MKYGWLGALGILVLPVAAAAFEKIAYIDSFDYPAFQETETPEGTHRILDNVLKTGATVILWRNQSGGVPRYPSAEEALPLKEPPLDKRRLREHMGRLDEKQMQQVDDAIKVSFGLPGLK